MQKNDNPKVSVIMATYNSEKFLAEAIESILNQTFKDFEFIILDDCSSDNSAKILEKYKNQDNRIILVNNPQNIGLTKSLNIGLKMARGQYIARMDADDVSLFNRLELQYEFLENNSEIFLIGSSSYNIDEMGKIIKVTKNTSDYRAIKNNLYFKNCIVHSSIMFKNEQFLYREKFVYSQDYDFYLYLLLAGKNLSNINQPLIKHRINPNAISSSKNAKQKLFSLIAKEFYQQRLKYGQDEYDKFDPTEILKIDVEKSTSKIILESEIKASFKLNDFKRVRKFCKKYFKLYGIFNQWLKYYLASFAGRKVINLLRRIIF